MPSTWRARRASRTPFLKLESAAPSLTRRSGIAQAFARRDVAARAKLLAHVDAALAGAGADSPAAHAALVDLVVATDAPRAAAAARRLADELDCTRAKYWRWRATNAAAPGN